MAAARNGGDQNFLPILLRVLRGATAGATDITGGVPRYRRPACQGVVSSYILQSYPPFCVPPAAASRSASEKRCNLISYNGTCLDLFFDVD